MAELFRRIAKRVAEWTGSASAFLIMIAIVIVWSVTGPYFNYSENWQLVINTGTSIITFLMVFLIQNSQNRDSKVLHLKIDELIRTNRKARNMLIDLDQHTDEELEILHGEFKTLKEETDQLERLVRNKRTSRAEASPSPKGPA